MDPLYTQLKAKFHKKMSIQTCCIVFFWSPLLDLPRGPCDDHSDVVSCADIQMSI